MKSLLLLILSILTTYARYIEDIQLQEWKPIKEGVEYRVLSLNGPKRVHQIKANLSNPNVQLFVTPAENDAIHTKARNTTTFLKEFGMQVAINGTGYASANNEPEGSLKTLEAYSVSNGVQYGKIGNESGALIVLDAGEVKIVEKDKISQYKGQIVHGLGGWADGGSSLLIKEGNLNSDIKFQIGDKAARTAIGLSEDGKTLYLVVIEAGPRKGFFYDHLSSEGATIGDLALIMQDLGAYTALNLDGGESSTMVLEGADREPLLVTQLSDFKGQRSVGNHLGVIAKPLSNKELEESVLSLVQMNTEGFKHHVENLRQNGAGLKYYERQTKAYSIANDVVFHNGRIFYDIDKMLASLVKRSEGEEAFLNFESLKKVKEKPGKLNAGGIYKDQNEVVWFVKEEHPTVDWLMNKKRPINEYLASKLMDLFIGPFSPEVKLFKESSTCTGSKHVLQFIEKYEVDKNNDPRERLGELKLNIVMDLLGIGDRHDGNVGYVVVRDKLIAARIDFDDSFQFLLYPEEDLYLSSMHDFKDLSPSDIEEVLNEIVSIPEEYLLHVLNDGFQSIQSTALGKNYNENKEGYDNLGLRLLERKRLLGELLEVIRRLFSTINTSESLTMGEFENINSQSIKIFGKSVAEYGFIAGNLKLVRDLLERKLVDGTQILMNAALRGDIKTVEFLFEFDAAYKAQASQALINAANRSHIEMIKLLLEAGADPKAQNSQALDNAVNRGHAEIIKLLLNAGAILRDFVGRKLFAIANNYYDHNEKERALEFDKLAAKNIRSWSFITEIADKWYNRGEKEIALEFEKEYVRNNPYPCYVNEAINKWNNRNENEIALVFSELRN